MTRSSKRIAAPIILGIVFSGVVSSGEIDFNRDIRPILSDKCFLCHGPDGDNRKADLRLDDRESAIDLGAIVPGDPGASSLLERVHESDPDSVMPPPETEKDVSAEEAKRLREWIEQGAEYSEHWAFSKPSRPSLPPVADESSLRNPIDRFVGAKLNERGLRPSQVADRETLIRRLYLDLIGLPPTPAEVDAYVNDERDRRDEILIDRLLNSKHFGERWGRWWLDAARYADSDGYEKDKPRDVWFYRDWVINAINRDMPYDEFVTHQIAGDLVPGAGQDGLVATGFLRNSMVNEEGGADPEQFRVEGMFDRMDAIGKAILGLTTQCAQCHTHKYDPLSQHEYYQMFAALNDFHEATATVFTPRQQRQRADVAGRIASVEDALKSRMPDWESQLTRWADEQADRLIPWRTVVPTGRPFEGQKFRVLEDGSIVSESYAPTRVTNQFTLKLTADKITAFRLDALRHPQLPHGGPGRSVFGTGALSEIQIAVAPADEPGKKQDIKLVRVISDANAEKADLPEIYADRDPSQDDRVTGPAAYAIDGDRKTAWTTDIGPGRRNRDRHLIFVPAEPVALSGEVILSFTLQQLHGGWNSDDNQNYLLGRYRFSITDRDSIPAATLPSAVEQVLQKVAAERSEADLQTLFAHWRTTVPEFAEENAAIEAIWKEFPDAGSQLVVDALPAGRPTYLFKRGDFLSRGDQVEPGVPDFLNPYPDTTEPHRLRFARWLVADDAPTTARVIVNRIWQAYFGRGLVTTPEDFGFQSALPSHPALLDWLAVELMENGWSLKHIHRLIVQSATYRQSSVIDRASSKSDPYNQWLARGPRFRVHAEVVRDIALAASGLLNDDIGGPSVYPPAPEFLFQPPASYGPKQWHVADDRQQFRRSLYVHRYRSVPYPTLQVFDAPKGDASCVRRARSNTPLQALVLLNEPQFVDCARAMAGRVCREGGDDDPQRLRYACRLCISRSPTEHELAVLAGLLEQQRQRIANDEIDVQALVGVSPVLYRQLTGYEASEMAPWIVACRAILNLDETITKP